MRLNTFQIESLAKKILGTLEQKKAVEFREGQSVALKKCVEILQKDYESEKLLEDEVNKQLDQLERAQPQDGFNRHQMFRMMKKKIAEEKGVVL